MKRTEIAGRLAALEASHITIHELDESDPHVIDYRSQPSELAAMMEEDETGVSRLEHMNQEEAVIYWADKVAEAELLIKTGGRDRFDDIHEILMDRVTLKIYRNLSLEIAQENIDDYLAQLADARLRVAQRGLEEEAS